MCIYITESKIHDYTKRDNKRRNKKKNYLSPVLRLTKCLHTLLFLAQPARASLLGPTLRQPKRISFFLFVEQTKRKFWERQHDYSTQRPAGERGQVVSYRQELGRGKREEGVT
jgi:hypothetical protein